MTRFRRAGDEVEVRLADYERHIIRQVPDLTEAVLEDDPPPRMQYTAHPDDDGRQESFEDLTAAMLDDARRQDRRALVETIDRDTLSIEQAEAWMRVMNEARLIIGARLGIEDSGWEATHTGDGRLAILHALTAFQGDLIDALLGG